MFCWIKSVDPHIFADSDPDTVSQIGVECGSIGSGIRMLSNGLKLGIIWGFNLGK